MTNSRTASKIDGTLGDTAVDGLLAGAAAGVLMAIFMLIGSLLGGGGWRELFVALDPAGESVVTGVVTHLAVAGVYGVVFAIGWRWLSAVWRRLPLWLAGLAYALVLYLLAAMTANIQPGAAGEGVWLRAIPALNFAAAHLVYGLALGWLLPRFRR